MKGGENSLTDKHLHLVSVLFSQTCNIKIILNAISRA